MALLGSEVAELGREVCCCCSPVTGPRERPAGGGGTGAAEGVPVARGGGPVCAVTAGVVWLVPVDVVYGFALGVYRGASLVPVDVAYGFALGAKGEGAICLVGGGAPRPSCGGVGCDPGAGA